MGLSCKETVNTEVLSNSLDERDPCPSEILRAFVSGAIDELTDPFGENLPAAEQGHWLAIRYYLRAVEERLEQINLEQHH